MSHGSCAFYISGFLHVFATNDYDSYDLFIIICLIATATFTGGLWTTLLLRQVAGAFWLTLLVPAVLSGFSSVFLAQNQSNNLLIAVLCVIFAIYSVGGFLFARWLFFRAQDVGWSGGVISLPEWKFFAARRENAISTRNRKPIFALVKKEFQLHQSQFDGGRRIAGVAHWRHCPVEVSYFCQRFARRNLRLPHWNFLDVVAGHGSR